MPYGKSKVTRCGFTAQKTCKKMRQKEGKKLPMLYTTSQATVGRSGGLSALHGRVGNMEVVIYVQNKNAPH